MALIRSASIFCEKLRRTDLRTLAYAMVRRTLPMHAAVYEQGAAPTSLDLILEGHCKVRRARQGEGARDCAGEWRCAQGCRARCYLPHGAPMCLQLTLEEQEELVPALNKLLAHMANSRPLR